MLATMMCAPHNVKLIGVVNITTVEPSKVDTVGSSNFLHYRKMSLIEGLSSFYTLGTAASITVFVLCVCLYICVSTLIRHLTHWKTKILNIKYRHSCFSAWTLFM